MIEDYYFNVEGGDFGPEPLDDRDRLAVLRDAFLELADPNPDSVYSAWTRQYMRHGGGIRLVLNEIQQLSDACECDQQIEQTRADYLQTLLTRPRLRRRGGKEKTDTAQSAYVEAIVDKVNTILDATTPEEALAQFQMPTIVDKIKFDDEELTLEWLAGNHLYFLIDIALKEHITRREIINNFRHEHGLSRIIGNRAVRMTVAGAVIVGSLLPKYNIFHTHGDFSPDNIELSMEVLSGLVLALDTPEALRLKILDMKHANETNELHKKMAETKKDTDLALRMVYNSTRYGGTRRSNIVTDRDGTDDKEENLRRFKKLDHEFTHMNNDPGGKPYGGELALGYAARLLIERRQQLEALIDGRKSPSERRQLYLDLVREIIVEDLTRMRKGLSMSKFRKLIMNSTAVVVSAIAPTALSSASEALDMGRDTRETMDHQASGI